MGSKEFFNQVASQWDQMRARFYSEAVREKAMDVARVEAGKKAADIGAGSGFITEGLIGRGLAVVAVDQSQAMLAQMQHKFAGLPRLDFRFGPAERLPLSEGEVDYAFANMYLHHVESPGEAIREMTRILKPGGRLVITDADQHKFEFLRREHHDRWLGFKRDDVRRWFEQAGLKNISVGSLGEDCCVDSDCGSESARISIFIASGKSELVRTSVKVGLLILFIAFVLPLCAQEWGDDPRRPPQENFQTWTKLSWVFSPDIGEPEAQPRLGRANGAGLLQPFSRYPVPVFRRT